MTTQPRLRVGSLFAGIGGFDLAAERAGMEVVWQSEVDRHASKVLDYHWPEVPNYGDIHDMGHRLDAIGNDPNSGGQSDTTGRVNGGHSVASRHLSVTGVRYGSELPGVDVLAGGFPCQDYSVAGQRGGLAGDRGALWWEYHRLITELRPTWVVGENVPGLLSSRGGADFETIVGSLTECGYGVAWAVLDARYFGVAQRRRRVFIVGHIGGQPRPEVLALGEGLFGHPEPRREKGQDLAATLESRPTTDRLRAESGHIVGFSPGATDLVMADDIVPTMTGRHGDPGAVLGFSPTQTEMPVRGLQSEPGMKQQTFVLDVSRRNRVSARDDGLAPTLQQQMGTGGNNMPMIATSSVRRLTPLECERLQGFPDGWTDIPGNSDTQRYRQLGNAVAVPVVEWIMNRLVEVSE